MAGLLQGAQQGLGSTGPRSTHFLKGLGTWVPLLLVSPGPTVSVAALRTQTHLFTGLVIQT